MDAVSSMLFYNYCRSEEESARNIYGGFENLEAIRFIQSLNDYVRNEYPGVMMIAEESTAFAGVYQTSRRRRTRVPLQMEYGLDE